MTKLHEVVGGHAAGGTSQATHTSYADTAGAWSGTALVLRGSSVVKDRSAGLTGGLDSQPCNPESCFQGRSISKLVVVRRARRRSAAPTYPTKTWTRWCSATKKPRAWTLNASSKKEPVRALREDESRPAHSVQVLTEMLGISRATVYNYAGNLR